MILKFINPLRDDNILAFVKIERLEYNDINVAQIVNFNFDRIKK